jgi:hypothetical protein
LETVFNGFKSMQEILLAVRDTFLSKELSKERTHVTTFVFSLLASFDLDNPRPRANVSETSSGKGLSFSE